MNSLNIFLFARLLMHHLYPETREPANEEKAFDLLREIAEGRATVTTNLENSISLAPEAKRPALRAFVQERRAELIEDHRMIAQQILDELQRTVR